MHKAPAAQLLLYRVFSQLVTNYKLVTIFLQTLMSFMRSGPSPP